MGRMNEQSSPCGQQITEVALLSGMHSALEGQQNRVPGAGHRELSAVSQVVVDCRGRSTGSGKCEGVVVNGVGVFVSAALLTPTRRRAMRGRRSIERISVRRRRREDGMFCL